MNSKLMKLARMVLKFATTMVGEVEWIHEGELAVGAEVYTEIEGELIPVADGEYETENMKIVVVEGKVAEMTEITPEPEPEPEPTPEPEPEPEPTPEPEPEPTPEPEPDEKDVKIAELEAKIAELEADVEAKQAMIDALQEQLVKPVEKPLEMSATLREKTGKSSGAMKYFEN